MFLLLAAQGTVDQDITNFTPSTDANPSKTPAAMETLHLVCVLLLSPIVLVGLVGNGLYLWVLGVKMRKTVTTLWFLHLVLSYFFYTLLIPFFAVDILLSSHWAFGMAMCKLLNTCVSVSMFSSVFILTLISLDRYILIHHPIWSRDHRTVPWARYLIISVWVISFALSAPYLAFRETQVSDTGKITCINNYNVSSVWTGTETQGLGRRIHLAMFVVRFLLGFLLPFCTIVGCYSWVGLKMKEKKLEWAGKPFKVLKAAFVSFFVGWLPYHIYHGLKLYKNEASEPVLVIYIFTSCFNACCTPVLYLFVGERFWKVFRMSLLTLVKAAFAEDLRSSGTEFRG